MTPGEAVVRGQVEGLLHATRLAAEGDENGTDAERGTGEHRLPNSLTGLETEQVLGALSREAHQARNGLRHGELVVPTVVLGKGAGKREGRKTVVGAAVPGVEVGQPEDEVRRLVDDLDVESRNALLDLVPEVRILGDDDRLSGVDVALAGRKASGLQHCVDLPVFDRA